MIRVVIPFYSDFEAPKDGLRALRAAGVEFEVSAHQGALIYVSRNRGVNGGLSQRRTQEPIPGPSHFLFVDADVSFEVENVKSLLALKVPIAACPYRRHESPSTYQTGDLSWIGQVAKIDPITQKGVQARGFAGPGFMLVERGVFRHLPYPWFHHRMVERYDNREQCGEDVGFCLSAREAGYSIMVDFDHPVDHKLRTAEQFVLDF